MIQRRLLLYDALYENLTPYREEEQAERKGFFLSKRKLKGLLCSELKQNRTVQKRVEKF